MITKEEVMDEMINIDGINIHVIRKGKGVPLLWLHGSNGNSEWNPFLESLSLYFDVIAPEHPGFGLSESAPWIKDVEDLVYYYRLLLDYFELGKVHVIGQSFGGWLAAEFACSQTHRVQKLVLMAAAGLWKEDAKRTDLFITDQDKIPNLLVHDKDLAEKLRERSSSPEAQKLSVKNTVAYARFAWEKSFNLRLPNYLRWVSKPTLILWGEQDQVISYKYADYYASLIPHSEMRIIKDCGHLPYVEKMEETSQAIIEFLEK